MKYICKQVNPAYQQSPMFNGSIDLDDDFCYKGLFLIPTEHCYGIRKEQIDSLCDGVEQIADELEDFADSYYKNISDCINSIMPREDGNAYSTQQIHKWKMLAMDFDRDRTEQICEVLELVTGKNWDCQSIHGNCQGDYAEVIYCTNGDWAWNDKAIEAIEAEYFNTGSEWECSNEGISEEEANMMEDSGNIEASDSVWVYAYSWNDDDIKAELADAIGCDINDVIMYEYKDSYSVDRYEKI